MSLLMDALKRAEKARQAEAEKTGSEGRSAESSAELSLDPMEQRRPERDPEPVEERPAEPGRRPKKSPEDSLDFAPPDLVRELESLEDSVQGGVLGRWQRAEAREKKAGAGEGTEDSLSLALEDGDIPLDETGSTLPSMRAAQRSVEDYFDGTESMSVTLEPLAETGEQPAAPLPASPPGPHPHAGRDSTTQRSARAMLEAQMAARSRRGRTLLLVLLPLFLLLLLAGGGYVFKERIASLLSSEPTVVALKPPPVGRSPSRESAASAMQAAGAAPGVAPPAQREAVAPRLVDSARDGSPRGALAPAAPGLVETAPASASTEAADEASRAARAAPMAAAPFGAPGLAPERAPQRGAPSSAPGGAPRELEPQPPVDLAQVLTGGGSARSLSAAPSGFKITRRREPSRTHRRLMQGYEAFQQGDDGSALRIYQQLLARQPRNRDALLGAAAVYMRAGASEQAAAMYQQVLRRNPRDATAAAGLISLQENLDPVSGESRLRSLLAQRPGQPHLHFGLGNLYAEQSRWPEAQQAYFDAYRLDEGNPDYAFNLAVSLDHLAQRKPALEFYRRAVELASTRAPSFDPEQAGKRIATLGSL